MKLPSFSGSPRRACIDSLNVVLFVSTASPVCFDLTTRTLRRSLAMAASSRWAKNNYQYEHQTNQELVVG